jgi:predicted CXXCH cytochrome family protein
VLLAGVLAFLLIRWLLVTPEFGKYGHYRPQAIEDNRSRPLVHAGRQACLDCHSDVEESRRGGRHAAIGCEACHGPLAKHANDPAQLTPPKPDSTQLCARCHEADAAKPKRFPQVASREHMGGGACDACHKPHNPKI